MVNFSDGKISTDRLYPILVLSGLSKETLGQIWSLANQTTPGQLIKPELYLILALIAFAQVNIPMFHSKFLLFPIQNSVLLCQLYHWRFLNEA